MPKFIQPAILLFCLIVSSILIGCAGHEAAPFPECTGDGCYQVAQESHWPGAKQIQPFPSVEISDYRFTLPSFPKKVLEAQLNGLYLFGQDDSLLSFALQTQVDPNEDLQIPEGGQLTAADSAEMIFTQTPADEPPGNPADLWIWQRAMFSKCTMFDADTRIQVSHNEEITLYYWKNGKDHNYEAYVFNADNRQNYLYIYGERLEFNDFKDVIGSIRLQ